MVLDGSAKKLTRKSLRSFSCSHGVRFRKSNPAPGVSLDIQRESQFIRERPAFGVHIHILKDIISVSIFLLNLQFFLFFIFV